MRDKRKIWTFLFALILIALFTTLALLYYAGSQSSVAPSVDNAKIVAMSPSDHWGNPVGMAMDFWVNVTIRNEGANTIKDLTLNLTIPGVSDEIYDWGTYAPIGTIQSGETTEVQVYIILLHNGFENYSQIAGHDAVIQLISGDKILDVSSVLLP